MFTGALPQNRTVGAHRAPLQFRCPTCRGGL
jgi:hypothetical protein